MRFGIRRATDTRPGYTLSTDDAPIHVGHLKARWDDGLASTAEHLPSNPSPTGEPSPEPQRCGQCNRRRRRPPAHTGSTDERFLEPDTAHPRLSSSVSTSSLWLQRVPSSSSSSSSASSALSSSDSSAVSARTRPETQGSDSDSDQQDALPFPFDGDKEIWRERHNLVDAAIAQNSRPTWPAVSGPSALQALALSGSTAPWVSTTATPITGTRSPASSRTASEIGGPRGPSGDFAHDTHHAQVAQLTQVPPAADTGTRAGSNPSAPKPISDVQAPDSAAADYPFAIIIAPPGAPTPLATHMVTPTVTLTPAPTPTISSSPTPISTPSSTLARHRGPPPPPPSRLPNASTTARPPSSDGPHRPITGQIRPLLRRIRKHSSECFYDAHHEPVPSPPLLSHRPSRSWSNSNCLANRHLATTPPSRSQAMALKLFSNSGSSSSVKHFDIRLDSSYIVFRGSEDEASSAALSGSVVLCLTEPMTISRVDLTLSGILHLSWQTSSTPSMSGRRTASKERTFFQKSWAFRDPGKGRTETLPPDNYEWPFQCILEGSLPESVEGLKEAWIIYRLKAEITRKRGKPIVVRKPLRIVRTLDSNALELAHAMSVENIWPNKIEYSISIPNKAVAFGSFVQVDFRLISLLKGLVIGNITTQVKEEQEVAVDASWGVSALGNCVSKYERIIASDTYRVVPETDEQILDEAAEGYQFSRYLELPKSLNQCLQDCAVKGIKVRHKVKFNVQLHNPDGHVSELRANLPVSFYISPSLPIDENNDLVDQSPQATRAAIANDLANSAPPVYGKHTLDTLYWGVEGYQTPGLATSTPGTPYLRSRPASSENLASQAGLPNGTSVSPIALQNRLQDLHIGHSPDDDAEPVPADVVGRSRDNSSLSQSHEDYFVFSDTPSSNTQPRISPYDPALASLSGAQSGPPSQSGSNFVSRRTSEEEDGLPSGARTPFAQFDHFEDLAKVPSYTTAVKSPAPRTPYDGSNNLPSYRAAIRVPSPAIPEPPSAHLRNSPRIPGSMISSSPETVMNGRPPQPSHRNVSSIQDEERRLRISQMRGH